MDPNQTDKPYEHSNQIITVQQNLISGYSSSIPKGLDRIIGPDNSIKSCLSILPGYVLGAQKNHFIVTAPHAMVKK